MRQNYIAITVLVCMVLLAGASGTTAGLINTAHPTKADRAQLFKRLRWPGSCEAQFKQNNATDDAGIQFDSLGHGEYIVEVLCEYFAYQGAYLFAHYSERHPEQSRLMKLKGFESSDTPGTSVGLPMDFNGKAQTLSFLYKSRGIGDCGRFATFKYWNKQLVLLEVRARECTDELKESNGDPTKWPKIKI